jgi:hypothetical protein
MDASVVNAPTASPDETPTSNGPAKLIRPRPTIASGLIGQAQRGPAQ